MQLQAILKYLEQITHIDYTMLTPLFIGQERCGWVNTQWKERMLSETPSLFEVCEGALNCCLEGSYDTISHHLACLARAWKRNNWLCTWRNENFTAFRQDGSPFFEMERAAFRVLGLTSQAVHVNALTRLPNGEIKMWVGRRSPYKAVDPNRMDNAVGGGVVAGESIANALQREGWEEAGLQREQLHSQPLSGLLLSERQVERGLHREWLYVFDVWLEEHETPCNQDGEVAEHILLSLPEVEQLLVDGRFMIDAALVCIHCLTRLNYWPGTEMGAALARIQHALPGKKRMSSKLCHVPR